MLWFVVLTPTYHAAVVWRCALSSPRWSLHRAADVASAPPGLKVKHPDLSFYKELADEPEPEWREVLKQKVVRGSWFKSEVVFFHEPSETLILGDLIENHNPLRFGWPHRAIGLANAMLAPNGSTPRSYRWTFFRRKEVRQDLQENFELEC